jgi:hypothetical protein
MPFKQLFKRKPAQTAVKGRSPALIITIAIHAILLLIAGTFVAVTVVQRSETKFEGKQIARPKMKLKKLQVPVKIEQQVKRQAPSLSQRVTANTRISTKSADFKMPEVAGFGTGSSVDLSGVALDGSLGFASTQINVFGLKSSGEKLIFLLDTSRSMLVDEVGGIPAYKIIKDELIHLISQLPPTALFNVVVFDTVQVRAFSPELSAAGSENIQKFKEWLTPLNSQLEKIGLETLLTPGTPLQFEPAPPIYNEQYGWMSGLSYALQKGADSLYWLGVSDVVRPMQKTLWEDCTRGIPLKYPKGWEPDETGGMDFSVYSREKWDKLVQKANEKLTKENELRLAKNQPVRVISGGPKAVVRTYFPSEPQPPLKGRSPAYMYTGKDILDYIEVMSQKYGAADRRKASIGLEKKPIRINVIQFMPANQEPTPLPNLLDATRKNGGYKQLRGLKAIVSEATGRAE